MAKQSTNAMRFTDVVHSPRMLAPIEGYEKIPLVSLTEAVIPLVAFVPNVQRNVYIVTKNCKEPKDGLTCDQSAAIMLYTFESTPKSDSLYFILNQTLRSESREKLKPWFLYLRLILTALYRLPSKSCSAFRGITADLRSMYPKGTNMVWWGFSSCTASVEVLEQEAFLGKTGARTLFQIECLTAKDIKNHSFIQHEDEILLLPGRNFIVKSCLNVGNEIHIIQLKEIIPQFLLLAPIPDSDILSSIKPKVETDSISTSSSPSNAVAHSGSIAKHK